MSCLLMFHTVYYNIFTYALHYLYLLLMFASRPFLFLFNDIVTAKFKSWMMYKCKQVQLSAYLVHVA